MNRSNHSIFRVGLIYLAMTMFFAGPVSVFATENYSSLDVKILGWANACRDEVTKELNKLIDSNKLTLAQLFDTFYIPIPNTNPQKYHTQYDKFTDETIRIIIDKYMEKDPRIIFVVAVDKNGYVPTHNSKYSKPLTGNNVQDAKNNRTKRMFNDRTGLAAARNAKPALLQSYSRDSGETMMDLSVPISLGGKHWGAIRIGYTK